MLLYMENELLTMRLKSLRCGNYPGLSGWTPNIITSILVSRKQKGTGPQTEEQAAMEWKQRETESERRRYTTASEERGSDHELRNSALDVGKSKENRFFSRPSRGRAAQ